MKGILAAIILLYLRNYQIIKITAQILVLCLIKKLFHLFQNVRWIVKQKIFINNTCYKSCPNGTYYSYDNNYLCILGSEDKPEINPEDIADAYSALKEVVPQMDYDAVEMIIKNLKEYKLPADDKEKVGKLEKLLKSFDWDEMENLLN